VKKCLELGADVGINYKSEDFVERTKSATGGKGAISRTYAFICVYVTVLLPIRLLQDRVRCKFYSRC
jgi:hypothetical protein